MPMNKASTVAEPGPGEFEFLISGDIDMTDKELSVFFIPAVLRASVDERNGWTYYCVGTSEFSYSVEPPGVQMTFDSVTSYLAARSIADIVLTNLKACGRNVDLQVLDKTKLYRTL